MCNLTDYLTEEDNFLYQQLKAQREYEAWCLYEKQLQDEENAYNEIARQYFNDLDMYETYMLDKTYKHIEEWEIINN